MKKTTLFSILFLIGVGEILFPKLSNAQCDTLGQIGIDFSGNLSQNGHYCLTAGSNISLAFSVFSNGTPGVTYQVQNPLGHVLYNNTSAYMQINGSINVSTCDTFTGEWYITRSLNDSVCDGKTVEIIISPPVSVGSFLPQSDCDGSFAITPQASTGGIAPFTYAWANGSTVSSQNLFSGESMNCTVTNAAGCSATGAMYVPSTTQGTILKPKITPSYQTLHGNHGTVVIKIIDTTVCNRLMYRCERSNMAENNWVNVTDPAVSTTSFTATKRGKYRFVAKAGDNSISISNICWIDQSGHREIQPNAPAVPVAQVKQLTLRAYPNPTSGNITLETEDISTLSGDIGVKTISVLDLAGRNLYSMETKEVMVSFDFPSTIPSGTYFLCLKEGDSSAYQRIVLSK